MVARETVTPWWWVRCQAMVSGPASRPVAVSFSRQLDDQVDDLGRVSSVGTVLGRRERGSKAASPSAW